MATKVLISLPKSKNINADLRGTVCHMSVIWAEVIFKGDQLGLGHSRHFPKVGAPSWNSEPEIFKVPGDQNKALELLKRGTEFLLKIYKNKKYNTKKTWIGLIVLAPINQQNYISGVIMYLFKKLGTFFIS